MHMYMRLFGVFNRKSFNSLSQLDEILLYAVCVLDFLYNSFIPY